MSETQKALEKERTGQRQNEEITEKDVPTIAGMRVGGNNINNQEVVETSRPNVYDIILKAVAYLVKAQADLSAEMMQEFEELATVQHRIDNTKQKMDKKIEHLQKLTSQEIPLDEKLQLAQKAIMYYEFDQI